MCRLASTVSQWLGLGGATILGVVAAFLLAKPMLLIVAAAFVAGLFKVARGGKMDIHSILSMIPMFRSLPSQNGTQKEPAADSPQASAKSVPPANKVSNSAGNHCTRAWYLRPLVWLLGVVLLGVVAFGPMEFSNRPSAIAYSDFLDQLDAGNIASLTFHGTQIDGNFKHAIGLAPANGSAPQTEFRSQVPDFGDAALLEELHKEHVTTDVVSSSSWTSWLGRLPWPMVIILAGVLIAGLFKLLRGPGGSTDRNAPTHPMTALSRGLFGKKNQDGTSLPTAPPPVK